MKSGFWQAQTSGYALNAERNELQRAKSDGEKRNKWKVNRMRRYIDAEKVIEELSKVPWYNREDEKQAVRIVREFSTVGICRSDECENKKDTFFQGWAWNNFNTTQHTGCVENALNEVSE